MKTVIFGGSGFLGSHVAEVLAEQGHEVVIFDTKASAYLRSGQRMVIGDILDRESVVCAMRGATVVYHFAGLTDLDDATTKPLETIEQNIKGTAILLNAAVETKVARIVYGSTIYVYSNLGGFYRCSKLSAELYIEEYQRRYGLSYTIIRYGTLYGPRADARNSVWRYLEQALREGKIVFPGTGDEVREYIHVRDAAKLSVDVLSEDFRNQPVVITGHHSMRAADLLNMIREMLSNRVKIEYGGPIVHAHYTFTPYAFTPKIGRKLVNNCYTDMGQGLLECLQQIAEDAATPVMSSPSWTEPHVPEAMK